MSTLNLKPLLLLGLTAVIFSALPTTAWAQWGTGNDSPAKQPETEKVEFRKIGMSGPRFGVTYVIGDTAMTERLQEKGMDRVLSQFGWHFERRVTPTSGGPELVLQGVPLVAGVEYGKILPSFTGLMGIRFPQGWEFGIGPNLMVAGLDDSSDLKMSLVTGVGYSFRYGGVSLPVNVAFTTNPDGNRVTLLFGYAIRR
jgi:hypothetical protein